MNLPADDPFDILGVEPRFDLSATDVRAAYLRRSAVLHPDAAGPGGGENEAGEAAALNEAKRVLENPERRAEALLNRLGGPRKEQDRSLPQDFLQEMLGVREEIETATASGDRAALSKWETWADERRRMHIKAVGRLFGSLTATGGATGDPTGATGADFGVRRAIRMELNMWRYVERLIEQMEVVDPGGGRPGE